MRRALSMEIHRFFCPLEIELASMQGEFEDPQAALSEARVCVLLVFYSSMKLCIFSLGEQDP